VRPTRRTELAAFLRAQRARLTPADVGLPEGSAPGRRRTPGLRREEVAQLSGVGVTWYTWLEQGRDIAASAQVIDALVRALRLTPDQHRHLRELAGLPPPEPQAPAARAVLSQFRAAAGRDPGDSRFAELVAALTEASPQFRDWWAEYPVRYFRPATIGINHPQAGLITLQMFQLRLVEQPDLIMVIQVPDRPAGTGS
jgi:transcriptional regulator with XRE-family HTH domain